MTIATNNNVKREKVRAEAEEVKGGSAQGEEWIR